MKSIQIQIIVSDAYDGIWFWNSSQYFGNVGHNPATLKTVFSQYGSRVVDIFLLESGGPEESGAAPGIGSHSSVNLNGMYWHHNHPLLPDGTPNPQHNDVLSDHANTLIHEIGHTLNLRHSFVCNNECKDVDVEVGLECNTSGVDCATGINGFPCSQRAFSSSNNYMRHGYGTQGRNNFTPCQLGIMRHHLLVSKPDYLKWDFCDITDPDIVIKSGDNILWNTNKYLRSNVVIQSGGTLTITCTVGMPTMGQIIVEQGGSLIVDGGTITKNCEDLWAGIQVYGVGGSISGAGKVSVQNEGTIEYARTGISSWNGGAVVANNANFYNNRRSVEFLRSPNSVFGYFTSSDFIVDEDLPEGLIAHVTAWSVRGLSFSGCLFKDERAAPAETGEGIYTIDANFRVNGCEFIGLEDGIEATMEASPNTFQVTNSEFTDNEVGIRNSVVDFMKVTGCTFNVGYVNAASIPDESYGIYTNEATGYKIMENTFNGVSGGNTDFKIGVGIKNSGDDNNDVRLNEFNSLTYGNLADGDNGGAKTSGLRYICNDNNTIANADFQPQGKGVCVLQWSTFSNPAGNKFAYTAIDFNNLGAFLWYFYGNGANEEPLTFNNIGKIKVSNIPLCGDDPEGPDFPQGEEVAELSTKFQAASSGYNTKLSQYNSLLDNGDTQVLISDIQSSSSGIYTTLLNISPWLSIPVLTEVLNSPTVFTSTEMVAIFSANPEAVRYGGIIEIAQQSGYFTTQQIESIETATGQPTSRITLESEMAAYLFDMHQTANIAARLYVENPDYYDLFLFRQWMDNKNSLSSAYDKATSWLYEGNASNAQSVLNTISTTYNLSSELQAELANSLSILQLQSNLLQGGKTLFDYTSNEVSQIESIANAGTGRASAIAQNILNFAYDYNYKDGIDIELPVQQLQIGNNNGTKISPTYNHSVELSVEPNPANGTVKFSFTLPDEVTDSFISIYSLEGKEVEKVKVVGSTKSMNWNTAQLKEGIYIVQLKADGKLLGVERLVILR